MRTFVTQRVAGGWPWRSRRLLLTLSCGLLGAFGALADSGAARAQAPTPPDTLRLSWQEFRQSVDRHPRLVAAQAAGRGAAGATREARSLPNPGWEARSLTVEQPQGSDPTREDELTLSFPVDWIWTRHSTVQAARATESVAQAEVERVNRDLRLEAGEAFWALVRDQALAQSMEELNLQLQDVLQAVEARVRVGEARPVEATRARVEALQAELDAAVAQRALVRSRELLSLWLPATEQRLPLAVAELDALPLLPGFGDKSDLLREQPRTRAARSRLAAERSLLALEHLQLLPSVEVQASLERAEDRRARGVGVALEVPLFNWNRGRIAQARARVVAAEAQWQDEQRNVAAEWASATAAYESSREAARRYQESILPQAEEAARVLANTWRVGEANLFEWIDARRILTATRRQAILVLCQAQLDGLRLVVLLEKETNK
jgi:cobalt-zinc-cadmium efflux system outer membrane protein